jgi:secondary thiamine-phosphate synthase enzyme
MPFLHKRAVQTQKPFQIVNLTQALADAVTESGVQDGLAFVFSKHTTFAVTVNEDEDGLKEDLQGFLEHVVPHREYKHNDLERRQCPPDEPKNARAHLQHFLLGVSATIPVRDGKPDLGRWQHVFGVELDGPRNREVTISVVKTL